MGMTAEAESTANRVAHAGAVETGKCIAVLASDLEFFSPLLFAFKA